LTGLLLFPLIEQIDAICCIKIWANQRDQREKKKLLDIFGPETLNV
jgi:hypothetical protein